MNPKPKIIGIDFDDVLMDFNGALRVYHNLKYGTSYAFNDIFSFNLEEIWKCKRAEALRRISEFYLTDNHFNASPIDGSVEGVRALKQNNSLVIITSKPDYLKDKTVEWLDKYFPKIFDDIYFTNQFLGTKLEKTKSDLCDDLGIHFFIDDSLRNAQEIARETHPVLLFNRPWNQGKLPDHTYRVHSWEEIVENLK